MLFLSNYCNNFSFLDVFFLFFTCLLGVFSFFVITVANPVHAIFFLVLLYLCSVAILITLNLEFLGLMLLLVYVGAIAVLFLFVIMMLNIKLVEFRHSNLRFFSSGFLIVCAFLVELYMLVVRVTSVKTTDWFDFGYISWDMFLFHLNSLETIGALLYTVYFPFFLLVGFILLLAMISSIVLTLQTQIFYKRQFVFEQMQRRALKI